MKANMPILEAIPIDFEKGSTLVIVKLNGKHIASFCGENSRRQANEYARKREQAILDEEDKKRNELGRTKLSRSNIRARYSV